MKASLAVAMVCAALPLRASACALALMFSIDASGSVDSVEWRLQTEGLAAALMEPEVAHFLINRDVRLSLYQWSGEEEQDFTIPWTAIGDAPSLAAFAARVAALPRRWTTGTTALATAMTGMAPLVADTGCARQVIDISGDGESNEFRDLEGPRGVLGAAGITVNVLAIEPEDPFQHLRYKSLSDYFKHRVIVGPGAFVEPAEGFEDYPRAIREKLRREVVEPVS